MISSLSQNVFWQYLSWHFFEVPKKILRAFKNILVFVLEYFSVPQLLRTFFAHWRRYQFSYPRAFDIGKYAETFFSNLISRVLGMVMRSFLISLGVLVEMLVFLLGIIVFLAWLLLPLILIFIFYWGLRII